jgi:GH24 family phage-related lysozyme (muramidase)
MLLQPGDSGSDVKSLQRGLNELGSMLLIDGDFGPATGAAVLDARVVLQQPGTMTADDALQGALGGVAPMFPLLTASGVTFIARLEVAGPQEYRHSFSNPIWPSAGSGITIGIGYDLQFVDQAQLRADWGSFLSDASLAMLGQVLGTPGSAARLDAVRSITIPLTSAMTEFAQRTLPLYVAQTRSIYPQVDVLPPWRRTSLVSLVYNRGTSLTDRDPLRQDRREMREIARLLAAGQVDNVAAQFDSMARLWNPQTLAGLVKRRHDEARLWRSGFEALQLA